MVDSWNCSNEDVVMAETVNCFIKERLDKLYKSKCCSELRDDGNCGECRLASFISVHDQSAGKFPTMDWHW